jgi:hypothetical protein
VLTAISSEDQAGHDEADGRDSGAESAESKDDRSVQEIRSPKQNDRSYEVTSALGRNDGASISPNFWQRIISYNSGSSIRSGSGNNPTATTTSRHVPGQAFADTNETH